MIKDFDIVRSYSYAKKLEHRNNGRVVRILIKVKCSQDVSEVYCYFREGEEEISTDDLKSLVSHATVKPEANLESYLQDKERELMNKALDLLYVPPPPPTLDDIMRFAGFEKEK